MIFHDHLSLDFVSKYSTDKIIFEEIVPAKSFSTNDLRFIIYQEYLKKHHYEWILMTDASDVFFNRYVKLLVQNFTTRLCMLISHTVCYLNNYEVTQSIVAELKKLEGARYPKEIVEVAPSQNLTKFNHENL